MKNRNEIKLSIICNTYNHEKYIGDAIESFLNQKTNFNYEILIHDDASTDNTASIIREYQNRYPTIIRPLFQATNKYSQGIGILEKYQYPRVKGQYIAFCEGDDYWIDREKLQKQVDFLDNNLDVDICAHGAYKINARNKDIIGRITPSTHDIIFSLANVIAGGGDFVATNSLVYRSSICSSFPSFRDYFSIDYTMQVNGSLRGGMGYLKDIMSAYRIASDNSWTRKIKGNSEEYKKHTGKVLNMLKLLDKDTEYVYHDIIDYRIILNEVILIDINKDYKLLFGDRYRNYRNNLSIFEYLKLCLKAFMPNMMAIVLKIKSSMYKER